MEWKKKKFFSKKKFLDEVLPKDLESTKNVEVVTPNFFPTEKQIELSSQIIIPTDTTLTTLIEPTMLDESLVQWNALHSFFGFRNPHSVIPVEQELEIEKIANRCIAESVPMFEKVMDSMLNRKLESLNLVSTTKDTSNFVVSADISKYKLNIEVIEKVISTSLSTIPNIQKVSYIPQKEGWKLIIIHSIEDRAEALNQIEEKILEIEQILPNMDLEPWILHLSEVDPHHAIGAKTILEI